MEDYIGALYYLLHREGKLPLFLPLGGPYLLWGGPDAVTEQENFLCLPGGLLNNSGVVCCFLHKAYLLWDAVAAAVGAAGAAVEAAAAEAGALAAAVAAAAVGAEEKEKDTRGFFFPLHLLLRIKGTTCKK